MKTVPICMSFLKRNIFPICITMVTLAISIFMLITIIGKYEFQTYTLQILENSNLLDAIYCMPIAEGDPDVDHTNSVEIQNTLKQMEGVSEIIDNKHTIVGYNESVCNVYYYDANFRENFQLTVQEGKWFSGTPTTTEAVIGGVIWDGIKVGDTVNLENGMCATVIGIIGDSVVYPSLTYSTNGKLTADDIFAEIDNVIFVTEETVNNSVMHDNSNMLYDNNFFVTLEEEITDEERNGIIQFLQSRGNYRMCQQIIDDSHVGVQEWLKENLPLPLFLIGIATINMVCICAVIIKRTMTDISKYYLMGCTRAKATQMISISMLSVFIPPIILNVIQAKWFPDFIRLEMNKRNVDYIIDTACLYPVFLYVGILLAVFICIPTVFYRRYTPLDLYRRNL